MDSKHTKWWIKQACFIYLLRSQWTKEILDFLVNRVHNLEGHKIDFKKQNEIVEIEAWVSNFIPQLPKFWIS